MAPGKNARRKQRLAAAKKQKARNEAPRTPARARDPNAPGMRLRHFIELALRADPGITLAGLLDATNAWANQGHTHMGYALWTGDPPFGPHYLGHLLREEWAAKLGSSELHRQARFFRENPDKNFDDLRSERQARLEALRAREAEKKEQAARKREEAQRAKAERHRQARDERERQERNRREDAERKLPERHTRALAHLVDFFRAAGIAATSDGRAVQVSGARVAIGKAHAASRAKLDALIDEVVWSQLRDALLQSISRHLDGAAEFRASAGTNGWVLSHDRTPLAVVRATSAKVKALPARYGNFLTTEGAPWARVAEDIGHIRARELTQSLPPRTKRRVFTELPDSISNEVRTLALDASRQLRTERNLVFGHAVELQYADGAIRFHPLRQGPLHLELPLSWSRCSEGSTGELRIDGRRDPLHLSFHGDDDDDVVVRGWLIALVGYAQLVCREDLIELQRPPPRVSSPALRSSRRSTPPHELSRGHDAPSIPGFKAIGVTRSWIASYVAGHRRQLRPGHHASSEARARATRVGITLRPGETWVSPHVRGVPPDAVLQFHWEAPVELRLGHIEASDGGGAMT